MNLIRLFLIFSLALTACVRADLYTASRACVRVSCSNGVGSGIVVGSDGKFYYALTNAHVATQATARVEFFDAGRVTEANAQVVQRDADVDLAVLKIDTKGYNPAIVPIDPSFSMKEGDVLCTIGHPLGKSPTAFFCTYRKTDPIFGVMFTPPPLEGRSGSPLLSKDGERVVGIVYGYTTADKIGLAIPAKYVADFVQGAVNGTKVKTKWMPPKNSSVIRFTEMKSILENSGREVAETRRRPGDSGLRKRRFPRGRNDVSGSENPRPRNPRKARRREGEPRPEMAPELTALKVKVGDVEVEADAPSKKPAEKQAAPPRPPQVLPPYYPAPWDGPVPPPGPPRRPGPRPAPAPHGPPPFHVGKLVETGTVQFTQYPLHFPPQNGNCPGGNCPNGNCPTAPKPEKPSNIQSKEKIPVEMFSPITDLIPDVDVENSEKGEKKKP